MAAKPSPKQTPIGAVIVPFEGSSQELLVQEHAVMLAQALGAPLKAIHVAQGADELPAGAFSYLQRLCWKRHVTFEKHVFHGTDIVGEIATEAQPNDLIVLGTRILGSAYHLGSVAEGLIHRAPCPVQVIRLGPARKVRPAVVTAARAGGRGRRRALPQTGWGA